MNKSALFFSVFALGLAGALHAIDTDPGYGSARWYGGRSGLSESSLGNSGNTPLYYRPTQRYYGPGYTVNYRYIPVYRGDSIRDVPVTGATNFRSEAFRLAPEAVSAWGVNSPKVTVKDPRSAVQRSAVTSIVRKKTSSKAPTTGAPAITPSGSNSGTPATAPANP
jgi:hypothetical protein